MGEIIAVVEPFVDWKLSANREAIASSSRRTVRRLDALYKDTRGPRPGQGAERESRAREQIKVEGSGGKKERERKKKKKKASLVR